MLEKYVLSLTEVLGGIEMMGELERRTSFMSSSVSSSFCSSLASQACPNDLFWKCIRRSSYTGTEEKTPNNGQSLTISYTSLYIILDMYLYSKAPSPGVNDFGCHRTCFSCQLEIILPLVYPDIDTTPATNLQS